MRYYLLKARNQLIRPPSFELSWQKAWKSPCSLNRTVSMKIRKSLKMQMSLEKAQCWLAERLEKNGHSQSNSQRCINWCAHYWVMYSISNLKPPQ